MFNFTVDNIPFGIISTDDKPNKRLATAYKNFSIDLPVLFSTTDAVKYTHLHGHLEVFSKDTLNPFISLGRLTWIEARVIIQYAIASGQWQTASIPLNEVTMHLPIHIGDYTDFYASKQHATNVGRLFRPDNPLMPNWVQIPVAYHGRASSVVVHETPIHRPKGMISQDNVTPAVYEPSKKIDFEVELGVIVGKETNLGETVSMEKAYDHLFGIVLLNDWSARDIQKFEYQPLGPFLGKSFATTISPWVITMEALEPFRCTGTQFDPAPAPHLAPEKDAKDAYDIHIVTRIDDKICSTVNSRSLYWSFKQMMVHHTSNGCNLRVGDLLGTGTISDAYRSEWEENSSATPFGSLLEATNGK